MGRRTFKNSEISSVTFTDLAGNTGMTYPNAGELEVPATPYESRQQYNIDGTLTTMPAQDERIGYELFCDICGIPVDSKSQLTKVGNRQRCKDCIDE